MTGVQTGALPIGMTGGKVTVGGNAGECIAQNMAGGEIVIKGDAYILTGLNMKGGKITIEGDAVMPGADMTGGEITVKRSEERSVGKEGRAGGSVDGRRRG